jgi:hypothetical protein
MELDNDRTLKILQDMVEKVVCTTSEEKRFKKELEKLSIEELRKFGKSVGILI